jgi:tryptophan-rich sensory protein
MLETGIAQFQPVPVLVIAQAALSTDARESPMLSLVPFLLAVALVAGIASQFMPDAWHMALRKPLWNPPNWVFAPVWTTLYVLIAIAGWLVWQSTHDLFHPALLVWIAQLLLNGLWTFIFFGRHRIDVALLDISALLVLILLFIAFASTASPLAAILFVPYLLWVSFASALNFSLWRLNPKS